MKNFRMYREAANAETPSNMDDIGQYEIDIIIRYKLRCAGFHKSHDRIMEVAIHKRST